MFQSKIYSQYTSSPEIFEKIKLREGQTSSLYSPRNKTINSTPIYPNITLDKNQSPGKLVKPQQKQNITIQTPDQQTQSQDGFHLNKSKFKLKDILFSHKDDIKNLALSSMSPQQKSQMIRIKKNQHLFTQLSDTLTNRKLTFAKFAFRFTEIDDDHQMKPILKGLYDNEPQGTMLVSELWTKEQMRQYLGTADLQKSKRVLRRFAHWDWDSKSHNMKLQHLTDTIKVDIFSKKSEFQAKLKLSGSSGEKRLQKEIRRRWKQNGVDIGSRVEEFGQQFDQKFQAKTVTNKLISSESYKKQKRLSLVNMLKESSKTNQIQVNQLKGIIVDLNSLHEENTKDHNNLKLTLTKLQQTISHKEKQKNYFSQIPTNEED